MSLQTQTSNFEYMNKESIDDCLLCALCKHPLLNPVSTDCIPESHTCCRNCIENWIKTDPSCPICHEKLHIKDLTDINTTNFLRMLNKLLVKCLICNQTDLKRSDFSTHYNENCPKVEVKCPSAYINCSWLGPRDKLEKHLKTCTINLIKPLFDEILLNYHQMQQRQEKIDIQSDTEDLAQPFLSLLYQIDEQRIDQEEGNKQLQLQCEAYEAKIKELTSELEQRSGIKIPEHTEVAKIRASEYI